MTLILKLDLDIAKMYQHTKNEVSMSRGSKVIALTDKNRQTDRQTDRHDRKHYLPTYAGGNKKSTISVHGAMSPGFLVKLQLSRARRTDI